MVEKGQTKTFARKFVPRIIKAALLVIITYLPLYFLSAFIEPFQSFFPWYAPTTNLFAAVFMIFLVVGVFTSGTIYQYVFGVARTLVTMIFFIYVLNGGIVALAVPVEGASVNIMVDLTVILAMIVLVCLLGIGKNVVQAIDFVSAKGETKEL
ncbi:MAG: hypothetical protein OEY39_05195 [Candidatus Bathyarchaeota archaeon]|nr:hypothetical protein [Candidatus Bathyarchaeota archaeon]MDH5636776.1 hypothetical protein [Candidatus Bathyarchaeota archaeon]